MEVSRIQQGRIAILSIKGPLVEESLDVLDKQIDECVAFGIFRIMLDISGVPFIDSVGLEKIQGIITDMGLHGGDVCIVLPNAVCRDILSVTRINNLVLVCESRESAFRSLS